jgi:hypothetical protein
MRLTTDRRYRFPFGPDEFWRRISLVDHYQAWWPWLHRFDAKGLDAGDVWSCTVHPPVPYAVRFTLALDEIEPDRSVAARIDGDIVGRATLSVERDGTGSCVRLVADLQPDKQSLKMMSLIARPLVTFGHNWILDVGVRQFTERSQPRSRSAPPT